jgi:hypothetical protein
MDSEKLSSTVENENDNKSMFSYNSNSRTTSNDILDKKADITTMSNSESFKVPVSNKTSNTFSFFSNINLTTIFVIIAALALLGFNIFRYLSDATETTSDIFRPLISRIYNFFGFAVTETAKKTVEIGAEGTKLGVDVIAGTVDSAIDITQDFVLDDEYIEDDVIPDDVKKSIKKKKKNKNVIVTSDDSQSVFQKNNNKKSGWCYIGEDKGVRNCINVKEGDVCMSENIFPTRELCTNPNLRE